MTGAEVEAALVAWLAAGAPDRVAGLIREANSCPIARACRARWHHRYVVHARVVYLGSPFGDYVALTPTLQYFVSLVDAEARQTVTFARCRDLMKLAKEATA